MSSSYRDISDDSPFMPLSRQGELAGQVGGGLQAAAHTIFPIEVILVVHAAADDDEITQRFNER